MTRKPRQLKAAKAVLRGKFIAILSYLKKEGKHRREKPNFTPKTTGKTGTKKYPKSVEGKKS